MQFKTTLLALALAAAAASTQAEIIRYDFTTTLGSGSISFDDSNTVQLPRPTNIVGGGGYYAAQSMRFNGVDFANPLIAIFNNLGNSVDGVLFLSSDLAGGFSPDTVTVTLSTFDLGYFASQSLTELRSLDVQDMDFARTISAIDAARVITSGTVTSLTRVPEPGSAVLVLGALAALAGARLRTRR